jgi:hypothetical protein
VGHRGTPSCGSALELARGCPDGSSFELGGGTAATCGLLLPSGSSRAPLCSFRPPAALMRPDSSRVRFFRGFEGLWWGSRRRKEGGGRRVDGSRSARAQRLHRHACSEARGRGGACTGRDGVAVFWCTLAPAAPAMSEPCRRLLQTDSILQEYIPAGKVVYQVASLLRTR